MNKITDRITTVLFDKDGTLIDTEKYYYRACMDAFHAAGYPMNREQCLNMRSLGAPFAEAYVREQFGQELDWEALHADRNARYYEILQKEPIELKPYAREAILMLKEHGFRVAVVTATSMEKIEHELHAVGIYDLFDDLFSAAQVKQGKPAPDVYAYACSELGIRPGEAVAIEDAPHGITSAYACGVHPIMVPDQTRPDAELSKMLYACCDDLLEMAKLLCDGAVKIL